MLGGGDCDDSLASGGNTNPNTTELCDGLDNDCDPATEAGGGEVDSDGDGVITCAGDCDDNDVNNFPGNTEVCDGQDNDCDVTIDEGFDADGDGVSACGADGVSGTPDDDCDDADATSIPGGTEFCDGLDNDCDGAVPPTELDGDGDGISECSGDCDDADPAISPNAPELCDGLDNDCDGDIPLDEQDIDLDGVFGCANDCNDNDATVAPGLIELCDGLDNDCDQQLPTGEVDNDGDRFVECTFIGNDPVILGGGDCDDSPTGGSTNPNGTEVCDGVDNDCASGIDDLFDGDSDGAFDRSVAGCLATYADQSDCDDADSAIFPGAPDPPGDGVDQDCSGTDGSWRSVGAGLFHSCGISSIDTLFCWGLNDLFQTHSPAWEPSTTAPSIVAGRCSAGVPMSTVKPPPIQAHSPASVPVASTPAGSIQQVRWSAGAAPQRANCSPRAARSTASLPVVFTAAVCVPVAPWSAGA